MPSIFESVMTFADYFSTEKACWDYLVKTRWPEGFICPICGAKSRAYNKSRKRWICKNEHRVSATAGTVMHGTKLPLKKWFWAAYFTSTITPGISALQLKDKIDVCYETAYMVLQRLRAGEVNPDRQKLSGIVQVDEATIGGEGKGGIGRAYSDVKSIVIGAIEIKGEKFGRVRLRRISNYKGKSLVGFIRDHIQTGSTIITDGFSGYAGIPRKKYKHVIYEGDTPAETGQMLKHIHIIFSNLKAFINGTYHGVSRKHLQAYLNEFMFRFNRRTFGAKKFNSLLGIGARVIGPRYWQLYHAGRKNGWKHLSGLEV